MSNYAEQCKDFKPKMSTNRLIEKDNQGNWMLKGVPWKSLCAGAVITKDVWDRIYGALWKLMEYEDIGLSPDDIEMLLHMDNRR